MRRLGVVCLVFLFISITGCTNKEQVSGQPDEEITYSIQRYPNKADYNRATLDNLPKYKQQGGNWQVDLRSYDLSKIDIEDRYADLKYASFDSATVWPNKLPSNYNPNHIMQLGKDPGLRLKELHDKGITGKGISVAIIDQAMLVEHEEYNERIKMYEEIHCTDVDAQMHGAAVASILLGNTVGVAPEANLFYIAETHGEYKSANFEWDFTYLAKSIQRIIEVNKTLSKEDKIRVLSISVGWSPDKKGYNEVVEAVEQAKSNGIFVISSSISDSYEGFYFHGLGRDIELDPNSIHSYKPGIWWEESYYKNYEKYAKIPYDILMVPMDSRTTASPTGINDYVFYREGGWSWSIPYIAGLYTLACQVEPNITPDQFWEIALETGDTIEIKKGDKKYNFGRIVNPVRLIEKVEEIK